MSFKDFMNMVEGALGKGKDGSTDNDQDREKKADANAILKPQDFFSSPDYHTYPQAVCTFSRDKKTSLASTYNDLLCSDFSRMLDVIAGERLQDQLKERQQQLQSAQPLSGAQLQQLVQQYHFGNLQEVTTESLQEKLGTREWKKLYNLLFADVSSYFSLDPHDKNVLVCHMPEYLAQVRFMAPSAVDSAINSAINSATTTAATAATAATATTAATSAVADAADGLHSALVSCSCNGMVLGSSRTKIKGEGEGKEEEKEDEQVHKVDPRTNVKAANFILHSGLPLTQTVYDKLVTLIEQAPAIEAAAASASKEEGDAIATEATDAEVGEDGPCQHQYMARLLYLMLTQQLQCDDAVYQLFYKRERYADYFDQVRTLLARLLSQGLSNLNYDLLEMTKAAYVRANSFDIDFLVKALSSLHSQLKSALENSQEVNVKSILSITSRIYNTLEALDHATERKDLIKLYGLNQDREYAVPSITLMGCGYQHVKNNQNETVKCFYFYCPERQEFVVMRALVNSFFASPTLFMDTEVSLYDAVLRCYRVENAMFASGKLKNSKFSRPQEYALSLEQKQRLYEEIVLPNFATLRTKAYANVPRYFDTLHYTNNLYVVKVKGLDRVLIENNKPFAKAYFRDVDDQVVAVRVLKTSSNYEQLQTVQDYKDKLQQLFELLEKTPALEKRCVFSDSVRTQWLAYHKEQQPKESATLIDGEQATVAEGKYPAAKQTKEEKAKAKNKSKKNDYQPQHLDVINKFLALDHPDTFFNIILLDCHIVSGRIHPVLNAMMPLALPDRNDEIKTHLHLRGYTRFYKGKSETSPLLDFCKDFRELSRNRALSFLDKK